MRIALLTVLFASLLLFSMYSAALTSFLAVFKLQMPFDDLNSLYVTSSYKVLGVAETAQVSYLEKGSGVARKVYDQRLQLVTSRAQGLQTILEEEGALLEDHILVAAQVGHTCTVAKVKNCLFNTPIVFVTRKNSPYNGIISYRCDEKIDRLLP